MELDEKTEEVLESLWIHNEETSGNSILLEDLALDNLEPLERLVEGQYISLEKGRIKLTNKGRPFARNVVRRHRLAERLLADVLGAGGGLMHERACKFEHILDRGLEESICSLLGHPRVCPHGKPIPVGRCCSQKQKPGQRVVAALSRLTPGQSGKVAYIYAKEPGQLQKLTAMGILPGAPIQLIQGFPSYLFQVRQTQFAVDREIADTIYVRLLEEVILDEAEGKKPGNRGWRRGKLAGLLGLTQDH
ncbi:MAG: metal-dependent transcriptional regulator [Dehalococcoidales bacterium]